MIKNKKAFTLVELIVVVVILAVLGTIAFISLQNYSANSRDSVRITDLGLIDTSIGIFEINSGKVPLPSSSTGVIYSGSLLWTQGFFGEEPYLNLGNLSKIPVDPLYNLQYNYSVSNNNTKYQLGTIIEGSSFTNNILLNKTYALGSDIISYVIGNYNSKDIGIKSGLECSLVTVPSLNISNLPSDGVLHLLGDYLFVYSDSDNLHNNYNNRIKNLPSPDYFTFKEVLGDCSVNTIDELNLYISKISLYYQQLVGNSLFNEIIYDFNTITFRRGVIDNLITNGITVNPDLIDEVMNPSAGYIHKDTFTGLNNTNIFDSYIPDSFGSWDKDVGINSGSYILSGNKLLKTDNLLGAVYPIPTLPVTSIDRGIILNITDFAGGTVMIYNSFFDSNNYYGVELSSAGYSIIHMVGGIQNGLYPVVISDPISANTQIELIISGDNIKLLINNIERESIIDSSAILNGSPAIELPTSGTKIDNFSLIYK